SGALPDGGEDDAVHGGVGSREPVEIDPGEANRMQRRLQAETRVEHPAPGDAGDDQGYRERVEEDGPKEALAALFAVDHGRKDEAEDDGEEAADAEDQHVLQRNEPAL